jgi:hypothetical protein
MEAQAILSVLGFINLTGQLLDGLMLIRSKNIELPL